ncbi:MAG: phosphatidate cytidylyltransferase [Myxococcales bacterium]|nr:phosphatidate cytidylyltransferase [Myxococcales bacterium]
MNNLLARALTALVVVPLLIAAIEWRNPLGVWALVITATAIGLREWMNMTAPGTPVLDRAFGVAVGTALAAAFYWWGEAPLIFPAVMAAATVATFKFFLFRYGKMERVASRIAFTLAGYLYVGVLMTFLALVKKRPEGDGAGWVYVMLTVAWLSDTGAYFAGRFIGPYWPRKLYESVSPKKTLIGGFGGVLASVGALVIAKLWYLPSLSWADCLLCAVPANLLGQMGDLCESLIKRSVGVKDSGALLPGHGGMLDRIDALLFVCPYVYCYARFVFGKF